MTHPLTTILKSARARVLSLMLVAGVVSLASSVLAQALKPGEWRTYTSMRTVVDVALAPDSAMAWAVTNGGAFRVDLRSGTAAPLAIRTTDGLAENDLTSVAVDRDENVYFGSGGGGFDIYHPLTGKIERHGADIQQSSYTLKSINGITVSGDTVFLATAYGLSLWNAKRSYFILNVGPLGPYAPDSVAQVLVWRGSIYAAMGSGIAIARVGTDLQNDKRWRLTPDTDGAVRTIAALGTTILAGDSAGLKQLSPDGTALTAVPLPTTEKVVRLVTMRDSLYILCASGRLYATTDLRTFTVSDANAIAGSAATTVVVSPEHGPVIGSVSSGIAYRPAQSYVSQCFPPGPIYNGIADLMYAPSTDQLYVTNGTYGFGMFQPEGEQWSDQVPGVNGVPQTNFGKVLYDSVRRCAWYTGSSMGVILKATEDAHGALSWESLDHIHNGIPAIDDHWVASGKAMIDRAGRCVITVWGRSGQGLTITQDGETFTNVTLNDGPDAWQPYGCVTQDVEGNFWVGPVSSNVPKGVGLFWRDTVHQTYGNIPAGQGQSLPSEAINAVLTDQDDGIWVGSEAGVQIISNPYAITGSSPRFAVRSVPLLAGQIVHAMAVDGVGNKWIGTENGIFVVSPDGSDSVARFTKANSPLIDDNITALALDVRRGEAYVGTPSGISRFNTIYKQGHTDYAGIHVFPNPVIQNSDEAPPIHIDGLVAGSTVKVFTVDGRLVAAINGTALGSTVVWSGRDDSGRQVPSGLYLITATSPQSGENGTAKVVIVRKP